MRIRHGWTSSLVRHAVLLVLATVLMLLPLPAGVAADRESTRRDASAASSEKYEKEGDASARARQDRDTPPDSKLVSSSRGGKNRVYEPDKRLRNVREKRDYLRNTGNFYAKRFRIPGGGTRPRDASTGTVRSEQQVRPTGPPLEGCRTNEVFIDDDLFAGVSDPDASSNLRLRSGERGPLTVYFYTFVNYDNYPFRDNPAHWCGTANALWLGANPSVAESITVSTVVEAEGLGVEVAPGSIGLALSSSAQQVPGNSCSNTTACGLAYTGIEFRGVFTEFIQSSSGSLRFAGDNTGYSHTVTRRS